MSALTEVVVYVDVSAKDETDEVMSLPIPGDVREQFLTRLDTEYAGGSKVFCPRVYAACLNHVTSYEVVDHLSKLPWKHWTPRIIAIITPEGWPAVVWSNQEYINEDPLGTPSHNDLIQGEVVSVPATLELPGKRGQRAQPVRLTRSQRRLTR